MANRVDPYGSFNFQLLIDGVTEGHFTECSGLGMRIEAIQYREAGTSQAVRRIPGRVEYGDVILRYGLTDSLDLWNWLRTVAQGVVQRKNVSVVMLASDGASEAIRWNLLNAWPAEWRGAPLRALSQEVAIEEMRLVCDEMNRA